MRHRQVAQNHVTCLAHAGEENVIVRPWTPLGSRRASCPARNNTEDNEHINMIMFDGKKICLREVTLPATNNFHVTSVSFVSCHTNTGKQNTYLVWQTVQACLE